MDEVPEAEREKYRAELSREQADMAAFAEFLKRKFFRTDSKPKPLGP